MADEIKTLLLTGASRGIGHATVKRFGREGWRVLTCSRQPFDPRCPWPGGEDNHVQIDLADPKATIAAIEVIKGKIGGRLHALVNNAGVSPKGSERRTAEHARHRLADLGPCLSRQFLRQRDPGARSEG